MPDIFDLQDRAEVLMDLGRYSDAAKIVLQALTIDPRNSESLLQMSRCLLMLGQFDKSVDLARSALSIDPVNDRARSVLAEAYAMRGEPRMAVLVIREALHQNMQNVMYLSQLSRYLIMVREEPEAVQMAVNALAIDPEFVPALSALGRAKAELEVYDEALEVFSKGLSLEPNNAHLLKQIGNLLSEAGEVDGAKAMFLDALRNNPNLDTAAIHMSDLRFRHTLLYRWHYKMVQWFRESHPTRIVFFTGVFLGAVPLAEYAWKEYSVWARLLAAPAWFFLLILLSPFIVPTAGKVPAIFTAQYRHLFGAMTRVRSMLVFLLYLTSIGFCIAAMCNSGFTSRNLIFASYSLLITVLPVLALTGNRYTNRARLIMLSLAAGLYTWLWLTVKGVFVLEGFYGLIVVWSAGLIGVFFYALRRFRD